MRILLAASVVVPLVVAASAAVAGDWGAKGSAPMSDWTGLHLGIEGGGGWGSSTHNFTGGTHSPFDISGGLVGGDIGYDWQIGSLIAGVEGDVSWASLSGSTPGTPTPCDYSAAPCTSNLSWLGTVRGRLGYPMGSWMPYLTGGLAFGNVHACEGTTCSDDGHTGWTIGGGIDVKLIGKWSARAEYLYADLGSASAYTFVVPHTENTTTSIVRVGLDYNF